MSSELTLKEKIEILERNGYTYEIKNSVYLIYKGDILVPHKHPNTQLAYPFFVLLDDVIKQENLK